ncbi:MAG TPA: GerMN domain-containing protein, partial [Ilumatobacteraceae bacterium]|nr:GerMN domain-containing protein [Ilumatobacteraceae bacterium]
MNRAVGAVVRLSLVSLLALASCGFPAQGEPQQLGDSELPNGLRPSDTAVPTTVVDTEAATLWFVSDNRLVAVRHRLAIPVTIEMIALDLLAGPNPAEESRGLRTATPDTAAVLEVTLNRGSAVVQLSDAFADIPASDQVLAIGQLVLTLTDFRGVGSVQFVRNDEP